jgi:hypothetical protein
MKQYHHNGYFYFYSKPNEPYAYIRKAPISNRYFIDSNQYKISWCFDTGELRITDKNINRLRSVNNFNFIIKFDMSLFAQISEDGKTINSYAELINNQADRLLKLNIFS